MGTQDLKEKANTSIHKAFARRALVANSMLGSIQRFVSAGPLLQLISISVFQMGEVTYAVWASVLALASLFQLPGIFFVYRTRVYNQLILSYRVRSFVLLVLAASPFIGAYDHNVGAVLFFVCAFIINACHAFGFNICWPAIVRAGTMPETRGRVTGYLRSTQAAIAALLVFALAIAGPHALSGWVFTFIVLLFFLYSVVSEAQIRWMKDSIPLQEPEKGNTLVQIFRDAVKLFHSRNYCRFLIVVALLGACAFPLQMFFLKNVLLIEENKLFWYLTATTWIGIVSMQFWGRSIDKIELTTAIKQIAKLLCIAFSWIALVLVVCGSGKKLPLGVEVTVIAAIVLVNVAMQGAALVWFNGALKVVSSELTTIGVLMLGVAFDLAAALSALLVGSLRAIGGNSVVVEPLVATGWVALAATVWLLCQRWRKLAAEHS